MAVGRSPFSVALEAVMRPLALAAGGDALADRVRDLEQTVHASCERALALAIPPEAKRALRETADAFARTLAPADRATTAAAGQARLAPFADPEWPERALERPLSVLPGVGPRREELLAKRGLHSVLDLLLHFPARYDDRRTLARVGDLVVGHRATFVARVLLADFVSMRGRGGRPMRAFQAVVGDETGTVSLKWFHGGDAMREIVRKGANVLVTGEVRRWRFSKELLHPEVERLDDGPAPPDASSEAGAGAEGGASREREQSPAAVPSAAGIDGDALRRIVADYATPEGMHPRAMRRLVGLALESHADLLAGWCPPALVRGLPETARALRDVHAPALDTDAALLAARRSPAHERLVLEELYLLELGLAIERVAREREPAVPLREPAPHAIERAAETLPFSLTGAQRRVLGEIVADVARAHPMSRLLQGDVGSGKTAVAFLAALVATAAGAQSALMAPTELLAEQHARTIARLAAATEGVQPVRTALLTASMPRPEQTRVREALARGEVDLVIGTHALLQPDVAIPGLGLAIVDEQHRFGVEQRAALRAKREDGRTPHLLVMTATPIPRTLALTLWGDLDVSVIDEMPPGRAAVATEVLRSGEGRRVADALRETTTRGEQVYVVYPLVEESEKTDLRAATEQAERIARHFPDLRVDLVHGRLDAAARAAAMARFERGETQVLVSTTVIEVGVDVPNATLMIVEHAERFGLAQLHQLRGRVGRGARPGRCLLVARGETEESEARLRAMVETTDGFVIAEADLRIRGPGEFLGTRQSGRLPDLRIADLLRDTRLIARAREAALDTARRDPGLQHARALRRAVFRRWGPRLSLTSIG